MHLACQVSVNAPMRSFSLELLICDLGSLLSNGVSYDVTHLVSCEVPVQNGIKLLFKLR